MLVPFHKTGSKPTTYRPTRRGKPFTGCTSNPTGCASNKFCTRHQVDRNVLTGVNFFSQVLAPRFEPVNPSLDCVKIDSNVRDDKFSLPSII
jgi:hypothetical protein